MNNIASPGHKLGQIIGHFFEIYFRDSLYEFAAKHGLYCDSQGLRPNVRQNRTKVTWKDSANNPHDLDYVFESNGSYDKRGEPVAFIELAWRRYTKHSRNKAGEIEGALIHLGTTYRGVFTGAILGGEFTQGSLDQLRSHNISVLYIPFDAIAEAFKVKHIDLKYAESATDITKQSIIQKWNELSDSGIEEIKTEFSRQIFEQYQHFLSALEKTLTRNVVNVRLYYLYGQEVIFENISDAVQALEKHELEIVGNLIFAKFEVQIRFNNEDRIEGNFKNKEDAIQFLKTFASVT